MGDSWLHRLVVRGSTPDIAAFTRAAGTPERPDYLPVTRQLRTQKLSFEKLKALLPVAVARRVAREIHEPSDLVLEQRRLRDETVEVTYKFQLSGFECEPLIVAVSKLYPRLCFVLGCVASFVDQQSSMFIHTGQSWSWNLPSRRKAAIWAKVPEETDDNADAVTRALAEADLAMIDEVVGHWTPKATQVMATLRRGLRTARQRRSRGARRSR